MLWCLESESRRHELHASIASLSSYTHGSSHLAPVFAVLAHIAPLSTPSQASLLRANPYPDPTKSMQEANSYP